MRKGNRGEAGGFAARLNRDEERFLVGWRNGAKDFGWVAVAFGTRERGGREKERASGWINVKAYTTLTSELSPRYIVPLHGWLTPRGAESRGERGGK